MNEAEFQGYEIPADEGYEDEGAYEDEGGHYEDESYDPIEMAEGLALIDEYGNLDEERLADVLDGVVQQQNRQADLAQAQTDHHIDQVARDLEREHPQLRSESGVASMLEAAAELTGYQGDPQDLLEYTVANPQLVEDALQHMNGAGIFDRLWAENQRDPGVAFFLGSGGSGYAGM
jgi:hypothetical protein